MLKAPRIGQCYSKLKNATYLKNINQIKKQKLKHTPCTHANQQAGTLFSLPGSPCSHIMLTLTLQ